MEYAAEGKKIYQKPSGKLVAVASTDELAEEMAGRMNGGREAFTPQWGVDDLRNMSVAMLVELLR